MRFGDAFPDSWEISDKFSNASLVEENRLWKYLEEEKIMRFGDAFPDSWEISDKFSNASLVEENRLWKYLEEEKVIWIETSHKSGYLHIYVYCEQTGKYLCINCKSNERYSRARLLRLSSGRIGLFEYQEHFQGCRLPLKVLYDEENVRNDRLNVTTTSLMSNVTGSNIERTRSFVQKQREILDLNGFNQENNDLTGTNTPTTCSSFVEDDSSNIPTTPSFKNVAVSQQLEERPDYVFDEDLEETVTSTGSNTEQTLTVLTNPSTTKHTENIFTGSHCSEKMQLDNSTPQISAKSLEEKQGDGSVVSHDPGKENHSPVSSNVSHIQERNGLETDEQPSTSAKTLKYGDLYKNAISFKNAIKITGRSWEILKNGRHLRCQTEFDPDLWYFYYRCGSDRFYCKYGKTHATVKLIIESDGTKTLWGIENHLKECAKTDEEIMDDLKPSKRGRKKKIRSRTSSLNSEKENDYSSNFVENDLIPTTSEMVKYGDVFKNNSLKKFANAIKVTGKQWELTSDGKTVLCQTKENPNLWCLYRHGERAGLNKFHCFKCGNRRRYSAVKIDYETNGSIILWEYEEHEEECFKTYQDVKNYLENLKNGKILRGRCKSIPRNDLQTRSAKRRLFETNPNLDESLDDSLLTSELDFEDVDEGEKSRNNEEELSDVVSVRNVNESFDFGSMNSSFSENIKESLSTTSFEQLNRCSKSLSTTSFEQLNRCSSEIRTMFTESDLLENVLPTNLWIIPCTAKGIAKRFLFIVSKENSKLGSKMVLRGSYLSKLIYCCPKCEEFESEVKAIVTIKDERISVKFEETPYHKRYCYKIDL
uniref:Uncharacterized protein n=1 Tax=Panagrolaimus sp. JU765 TaxID=591449 RepID=A0AC34R8N6_9BILA